MWYLTVQTVKTLWKQEIFNTLQYSDLGAYNKESIQTHIKEAFYHCEMYHKFELIKTIKKVSIHM